MKKGVKGSSTADNQTINDLEFDLIRLMLHDYCSSDAARLRMVDLAPFTNEQKLLEALQQVKALRSIYDEHLGFPALDFDELDREIELLQVRGSVLSPDSFMAILRASVLVNDILIFFGQHGQRFPSLEQLTEDLVKTNVLIDPITKVLNARGEIRDEASNELARIRSEIINLKKLINQNFNRVSKSLRDKGYLGDITENFLNNRRLLSVVASHKRKVEGIILGSSKTGSLCYIEPKINVPLNNEMEMLLDDEREEIRRILAALTHKVSEEIHLIRQYNKLLVELDFIRAKSRLAGEIKADLPHFSKEMEIVLIDAYHPLLLLTNQKAGLKTLPQSISLDKFNRILVISGPNAGGKTISLKTVGLIQLMFQSGLLVPVNPNSRLGFFHSILTDIGDNQSIENQLSTYSYRLKRMKFFLEIANRRTLLLLDEFGTGSDPDLGGALAEVFFEKLYNKKCFGVITTHYANIKLKASQLHNALNGCMLFDKQSLEPLYQLSIGQPGSSFTFEVAEINGIDPEIINEAREKLDDRSLELDKMISALQKEKSDFQHLNETLQQAEKKANESRLEFDEKKLRFEEKLKTQQLLLERNNKYLNKGKKMDSFIQQFAVKGDNKSLLADLKKYLAIEKSKLEEVKKTARLKKQANQANSSKKATADRAIVVGSMVKLQKGKEVGHVMQIEKDTATVAFGIFRTTVKVSQLVLVK